MVIIQNFIFISSFIYFGISDVDKDTLDHEYHERLDTHCMVSERRADIECGDTMIYTIRNCNNCLPMPASARCCQTAMRISY